MKEIEYVFCILYGDWSDDIEYIEEQLRDERHSGVEREFITIGVKERIQHKDLIDLGYLTESIEEHAYELAPDFAEDYLSDLTLEKGIELEQIIIEWFNKNVEQPNFWNIKNETEITLGEFNRRFLKGE